MARKLYRQIGERIRSLRKLARLTQEQLAEQADLSVQFVGFIERGQAKPTIDTHGHARGTLPFGSLDSLEKLAAALGAPIEGFFRFQKDSLQEAKEGIQQIGRLLKSRRPEEIHLFQTLIEQVLEIYPSGKRS